MVEPAPRRWSSVLIGGFLTVGLGLYAGAIVTVVLGLSTWIILPYAAGAAAVVSLFLPDPFWFAPVTRGILTGEDRNSDVRRTLLSVVLLSIVGLALARSEVDFGSRLYVAALSYGLATLCLSRASGRLGPFLACLGAMGAIMIPFYVRASIEERQGFYLVFPLIAFDAFRSAYERISKLRKASATDSRT